jgi:hypothetical protein
MRIQERIFKNWHWILEFEERFRKWFLRGKETNFLIFVGIRIKFVIYRKAKLHIIHFISMSRDARRLVQEIASDPSHQRQIKKVVNLIPANIRDRINLTINVKKCEEKYRRTIDNDWKINQKKRRKSMKFIWRSYGSAEIWSLFIDSKNHIQWKSSVWSLLSTRKS